MRDDVSESESPILFDTSIIVVWCPLSAFTMNSWSSISHCDIMKKEFRLSNAKANKFAVDWCFLIICSLLFSFFPIYIFPLNSLNRHNQPSSDILEFSFCWRESCSTFADVFLHFCLASLWMGNKANYHIHWDKSDVMRCCCCSFSSFTFTRTRIHWDHNIERFYLSKRQIILMPEQVPHKDDVEKNIEFLSLWQHFYISSRGSWEKFKFTISDVVASLIFLYSPPLYITNELSFVVFVASLALFPPPTHWLCSIIVNSYLYVVYLCDYFFFLIWQRIIHM